MSAISCKRHETPRPHAALTDIANLKVALNAFEVDCGRFPTTAEGLAPLIARPTNIPEAKWRGPYLEDIPKDPWGHDYVYHCPGLYNAKGFDIYSCGPDGVSQTGGDDADDFNNWRK